MRGKCQKKEKAHVTTDNQDVTDVEAKAASDTDVLQYLLSRVVCAKAASDTKALQICLSRVVRDRSLLILFA